MTLNEIRDSIMMKVYGKSKDFGATLCGEIHNNGLTFDTLAAKWQISLPLLGMLIADHCYKLTALVDDKVHTAEEFHARFDKLSEKKFEKEPRTLVRYLYDEYDDKTCPICKSSLKIKFGFPFTLAFSIRDKGCVQPKCENYYKKTNVIVPKELKEGLMFKGGVNKPPTSPPPEPPKGQGSRQKETN